MARIERFEDLIAWQKARELTKRIYEVTREGPFSRDFSLRDQIRDASVSTMSNIAEGFERRGDREFDRFLSIAKGSVGEARSQLYVALDTAFLTRQQFDELKARAEEVSRLIAGLMGYLHQPS
jgi:four helix bundle protein